MMYKFMLLTETIIKQKTIAIVIIQIFIDPDSLSAPTESIMEPWYQHKLEQPRDCSNLKHLAVIPK